jgi:hypothetical protein
MEAARDAFVGGQGAVNALPVGSADELARLIERAILKRQRRVADVTTPPVRPRAEP